MSLTHGMNIETIRQLAKSFDDQATNVQQLETRINGLVGQAQRDWAGTDSKQFVGEWNNTHRKAILKIKASLDQLADILKRNATSQETTSNEYDTSDGQGKYLMPTGGKFRGDPKADGVGMVQDAIGLSEAVYHPSDSSLIPNGWRMLSKKELINLGVNPDDLHNPSTGFDAEVYQSKDGRIMFTFRGSEKNREDWETNAAGLYSLTEQDFAAISLAKELKNGIINAGGDPEKLFFSGHSLGGRLAQLAGIATGNQALGLNPAFACKASVDYAVSQREIGLIGSEKVHALIATEDPVNLPVALNPDLDQVGDYGTRVILKAKMDRSLFLFDFHKDEGKAHSLKLLADSYQAAVDSNIIKH